MEKIKKRSVILRTRVIFLIVSSILFLTANAFPEVKDSIGFNIGYIPQYNTRHGDKYIINDNVYFGKPANLIYQGLALQSVYDKNIGFCFLSLGVEYQRLEGSESNSINGYSAEIIQLFIPSMGMKMISEFGLYGGIGLSGKYLYSFESKGEEEPDKKVDLWVNAMFGYRIDVSDDYYLNIEGRLGFNTTNRQFEKTEFKNDDIKYDNKYAYDAGIYIGVGYNI